ncbi:MAG: membrane dipeptidase [Elusimicrobia bacterium]|nr:membrane dipeptidase [Elusimicrobiota bacterium]
MTGKWLRRLGLAVFLLGLVWALLPSWVDRGFNRVRGSKPASKRARKLAATLSIADLHADSLLWGRSLLRRNTRGQVDIPRLIEGHVALQVFGLVTKMPRHLSGSMDARTDWIIWMSWAQLWPWRTHASLAERALYQAGRLKRCSEQSGSHFMLIRSGRDLYDYLEARKRKPDMTAGLLAVEGAHALEGDLDALDRFYEAGVRMMSPTHFFDTEMGGSAHGRVKGGLAPLGRRWVVEMEKRRMIVDVAHASPRTVADVLALAKRPVVVSHTGVRGTCDNQRNLSDEQLRAVAKNGGLVGIGYWEMAVCGKDANSVARAIRYAANVIGVEHVALGSDFDGAIAAPFDAAHLDVLVDALLAQGFKDDEIRRIMGENTLDFLARNLP